MKNFLLTSVLGLSLLGCAQLPIPPITVPPIVSEVQSIAARVCGFVPIAQTVLGIFGAGQLSAAADIAAAICAAVNRKAGSLRAGPPTVNGVIVRGAYVR